MGKNERVAIVLIHEHGSFALPWQSYGLQAGERKPEECTKVACKSNPD